MGDAGVLVNPYDADSIADGLRRVLDDAALRSDLIARGTRRVRSFSWGESVKRVHAIYAEIAAEQ